MEELSEAIENGNTCAGIIEKMSEAYTRFRPQNKEADWLTLPRPHPAGDIPGSRTYTPADAALSRVANLGNEVTRTVAIDADMQFSQLETSVYLASPESARGLISGLQSVDEGTIRVWREWSKKACESRSFSDGDESVAIIQEDESGNRKARSDSFTQITDPRKDSSILWINTATGRTGIKFRVRQQKWHRAQPVHFASENDVPVSYKVELEGEFSFSYVCFLRLQAHHSITIRNCGFYKPPAPYARDSTASSHRRYRSSLDTWIVLSIRYSMIHVDLSDFAGLTASRFRPTCKLE